MLLITTGLRVGGLLNIKLENIVDYVANDIVIRDTGKTLEKFNKWFTFKLNNRVKLLIYQWVKNYRISSDSPYLFPSKKNSNDHMSASNIRLIFNKIVLDAGLSGKHLHPHALRHTFAHMLLESGNSTECVAKIMGHSDSKTTSQFYLKESAIEAAERANIPWLDKKDSSEKKIVPDFLKQRSNIITKSKKDRKRKKVRMLKSITQELISSTEQS